MQLVIVVLMLRAAVVFGSSSFDQCFEACQFGFLSVHRRQLVLISVSTPASARRPALSQCFDACPLLQWTASSDTVLARIVCSRGLAPGLMVSYIAVCVQMKPQGPQARSLSSSRAAGMTPRSSVRSIKSCSSNRMSQSCRWLTGWRPTACSSATARN